jgi:hypothetical protein
MPDNERSPAMGSWGARYVDICPGGHHVDFWCERSNAPDFVKALVRFQS